MPRKPTTRKPGTITEGMNDAGRRFQEIQHELHAEDDTAGAPAQAAKATPTLDGRTSQEITADVNSRSRLSEDEPYKGREPIEILHKAIALGDAAKTEESLKKLKIYSRPKAGEHNINSNSEPFAFPHPLLHRAMLAATQNKSFAVAELLVDDFGANVNAPDKDGKTALQLVTEIGDAAAVDFLKSRGAEVIPKPAPVKKDAVKEILRERSPHPVAELEIPVFTAATHNAVNAATATATDTGADKQGEGHGARHKKREGTERQEPKPRWLH